MRHLRNILFATDLFSTGQEVLQTTARLATLCGAKVHLVHAVKRHSDLRVADFPLIERASEALAVVKDQLSELGVVTQLHPVELGVPGDVILRNASKVDADLLVIGCGRHLLDARSPGGSTAEWLLQRATPPVLAVYPDAADSAFQRILCPVDHSATSRRGLLNAIRLSRILGSELTVLSVIPDVSWLTAALETGDLARAQEQHEKLWERDFDDFLSGVDWGDVPWTGLVRHGVPGDEIVKVAAELTAGLIVMGATGRSEVMRAFIGSVTRRVIRQLPCSLLIVKAEDLIEELDAEDARVADLLFAEAESLVAVGSWEAAVGKLDQVLSHHPFHVAALLQRATALEKLGLADRADRSRRRALAIQASMRALQG